MTNKKLTEIAESLVNEFCAANGLNPAPGQKGGDREEANVMVGRAIRAAMPAIRKELGLPVSPAPALALTTEEVAA